jgi:hypothetical protein
VTSTRHSLPAPNKKGDRYRTYRPYIAPQVGLEPTTLRLTAACSAIELLRNSMGDYNKNGGRVKPILLALMAG